MILKLRRTGDVELKQIAEEVPEDMDVSELVTNMISTMNHYKGVGIAANQVGCLLRIIVIKIGGNVQVLINPVIKKRKLGKMRSREGCLSFPDTMIRGHQVTISRDKMIIVEGFNQYWKRVNLKLRGLDSACVQHEIDHLNGITIK